MYDYRCRSCGAVEEVRHGFGEHHTAPCASCGGVLERQIAKTPILFKGSGFYVTDSRKSSNAGSSAGTAESKPAESKPAETKPAADAKPASDAA